MPAFQPQPTCEFCEATQPMSPAADRSYPGTGYDFYSAHALNPDPYVREASRAIPSITLILTRRASSTLYNSVMGRIGSYPGLGLDHRTARHWHSLIYSGMVGFSPFHVAMLSRSGPCSRTDHVRADSNHSPRRSQLISVRPQRTRCIGPGSTTRPYTSLLARIA